MKVLTGAQMRRIDRRTTEERGLPSLVLMENAGSRVFEFLAHRFSPLGRERIAVLCGKGNNGGDGLVVARRLHTRTPPGRLTGGLRLPHGSASEGRRILLNGVEVVGK